MFDFISKAYARELPPPITEDVCRRLGDPVEGPVLWANAKLKYLECIFNRVYWAAVLSVGGVFIIWAIISGIRFLTAGGDEKAVAAARKSLTFAITGFIIVVGAYAIIEILGNLIGGSIQIPLFRIPD